MCCIDLIASIIQLTAQIVSFVSSVRDARRDVEAVSRELIPLSLCLGVLRDDSTSIHYPDGLRQSLLAMLKNCDIVRKDMSNLLNKLSSANTARRIQWTTTGRDDMNKLRSSLESHKSALDIAPDLTNPLLTSAVKEDTKVIRYTTTSIKQDTSQITDLVLEISSLRAQLNQHQQTDSKAQLLKGFLDDSVVYAETIADSEMAEPTCL
jgi:Fungal N-terminal domain of STAND proteins